MFYKKKSRSSYHKNIGRRSRNNRNMNGGLGSNDSVNIGLQGKYVFTNEAHKYDLGIFTFGTDQHYRTWIGLLTACKHKIVPFYILSAGDKIGIIRTLQLLGIDDMVHEVLCTNKGYPLENRKYYNPDNTVEHNFHGKDKYHVIEQIVREYRELNCTSSSKIGYLIDDMIDNVDISNKCPSIKFEHVLTHKEIPEYIDYDTLRANLQSNPIYNLNVNKRRLQDIQSRTSRYNFIPIDILKRITDEVNSGDVSILFVDFDETFQIWDGTMAFGDPTLILLFNELNINIDVIQ